MELTLFQALKIQPFYLNILFLLGSLSFLKLSLSILTWVYANFLRPPKSIKKYGSWAIVTGSTGGIGKAFAFELAMKGLNLILVGRNPNKLEDVSSEIQSKFPKTQIKNVVFDLTGDLSEGINRIIEVIEGLDVRVLIEEGKEVAVGRKGRRWPEEEA